MYSSSLTFTPPGSVRLTEANSTLYGYGNDVYNEGKTAPLLLYLQERFGPVSSFTGSPIADRWHLTLNRTTGESVNVPFHCEPVTVEPPINIETHIGNKHIDWLSSLQRLSIMHECLGPQSVSF